ncbi:hypothetical protein [Mesoflavibacter sp. CH_XMU1422-2]|uniref:hypothetical protein n=1 Tax=Mesoflavibacter sp. CH_XMU1422-2 TaxID=3107770 RepID=UPI003009DAB1
MKHYISILIFVLVCSFSNAQEKQNDATWQETVNFLNKYKSYFKLGFTYNNNLKKWDEYQIEHISITQQSLYFKATKYNYKKQKSKHIEVSIPFAKLQDIYSGFRQEISTVGNNISFKYRMYDYKGEKIDTRFSKDRYVKTISFRIQDDEMRKRIIKAFKHLIYLAEQKRIEKQKQSGDKF